jgi:hypothetical protein
MKKQKPLVYQPPTYRDLMQFNVIGQVTPNGLCISGANPIYRTCQNGTRPSQPSAYCAPTGELPTYGRCTLGGVAVEGCDAGSSVNQCVLGSEF